MKTGSKSLNVTEPGHALQSAGGCGADPSHATAPREQRLAAVATMAGGMCHEFNNILGAVLGYASFALTRLGDGRDVSDELRAIVAAARRGADLTKQWMRCTAQTALQPEWIDVHALLRQTVENLPATVRSLLLIQLDFAADLWPIRADVADLGQAFTNLLRFAADAMPGGGSLTIRTRNGTVEPGHSALQGIEGGRYVEVQIGHTGRALDEVTREFLFDPYMSGKSRRADSGLAMATVYGIVRNHGGHIRVGEDAGTCFEIWLPAATSPPAAMDNGAQPAFPPVTLTPPKVLLVDDEATIGAVGGQLLRELGCTVVVAGSAREALIRFEDAAADFDLVILDLIMPELDGRECFFRLRAIRPDVRVLLSSGYAPDAQVRELLAGGAVGFLQKPFGLEELRSALAVLRQPPGQPSVPGV